MMKSARTWNANWANTMRNSRISRRRSLGLAFLLFASLCQVGEAQIEEAPAEWRTWRGNDSNGITSATDVPSEWNLNDGSPNIRWRVPLPGPGNSSPIVSNGMIWITQFDPESGERQLRCYDVKNGTLKWKHGVKSEEQEATHPTNPYCAASPVTDGTHVVAYLGAPGIFCFSQSGELVWTKQLDAPQHLFGQGASPTIHGDLVTFNFGPGIEQRWITWDLRTGEEKWRIDIPRVDAPNPFDDPNGPKLPPGTKLRDPFGTWATAVLAKTSEREELLLANPHKLLAVDPKTGNVLWECQGTAEQVFCSPLVSRDSVCMLGAKGMLVRLGGSGDVTDSKREWFRERDRGRIGSGVIVGEKVIANDMQGIVEAISLSDGKRVWQQRLASEGGSESWSSLALAGDRIFATSKTGTVFVFHVEPEFKLLATNKLGEPTNASPAITRDAIYVRTDTQLWCIAAS
ncbi:PQQ-binding-like beta-propeller repeat protein [Pirellulaceae bacterium SH501]